MQDDFGEGSGDDDSDDDDAMADDFGSDDSDDDDSDAGESDEEVGDFWPMSQWVHKSNVTKIICAFVLIMMIWSGRKFAHVMTELLSWHVQNCDMITSLFVALAPIKAMHIFTRLLIGQSVYKMGSSWIIRKQIDFVYSEHHEAHAYVSQKVPYLLDS